uniref:RING-type domain-containing protein n=1 Tax=Panagrellus redivivus TaxID=6233 RepID=A0A7E4UUV4_PANRE
MVSVVLGHFSYEKVTIDREMVKIANCGFCHVKYNSTNRAPVSMPCGHTFCRGCIQKMTHVKLFACGTCHAPALHGWADTKPNLDMIQLLGKLNLLAKDDSEGAVDETPTVTVFPEAELMSIAPGPMHKLFEHHFSMLSRYLEERIGKQSDSCNEMLELLEELEEALHGYTSPEDYLERLDREPSPSETNSSPERQTNNSTSTSESESADENIESLRDFYMENLFLGDLQAQLVRRELEENSPSSSEDWQAAAYDNSPKVNTVLTNYPLESESQLIPPQTATTIFDKSIGESSFAASIIRFVPLDSDEE